MLLQGVVLLNAQTLTFRTEQSNWQRYTFSFAYDASSPDGSGSLLLIIPEGATPRLIVEYDEKETWQGSAPKEKVSISKTSGAELPWHCNNVEPVSLEPVGVMRGITLLRVRYSALTARDGQYVLHRSLRATIEFEGADKHRSLHQWRRTASKHFAPLMALVANSNIYLDESLHSKSLQGRGEPMALVAPEAWRRQLAPWLRWSRQCGTEVIEYYFDPLTVEPDTISHWLAGLYGDTLSTPPSLLLLVGSAAILPQYPPRHRPTELQSYRTDLYYAEFTGDYMPEMLIGRWSVDDTVQLSHVVAKTIAYERQEDIDSAMLRSALLVAGREEREPAPAATNGMVNYVSRLLDSMGIDTTAFRNPQSELQAAPIKRSLASGNALVGYTSHCTTMGWLYPTITTFDIDTMQFYGRAAFMVNNCCLSNQVGSDCFGEHLLRKADGAAVAVVGAAGETLWDEDYYWAVGGQTVALQPVFAPLSPGAYDWLLRHELTDAHTPLAAAQLLAAGNMAVTRYGSPYDAYYWEAYNLLGDPSLAPCIGVPRTMALQCLTPLTAGLDRLELQCEPYATITLLQADSLLGIAVCDTAGRTVLHCRRPLSHDSVLLTATKRHCIPAVAALPVQSNAIAATRIDESSALWPNPVPAAALLTLECASPVRHIGIVDSRGMQQHTSWQQISDNKYRIAAPGNKGVYYVVISTTNGCFANKLVVR